MIKPEYRNPVILYTTGCIIAMIAALSCVTWAAMYYGNDNDTGALFYTWIACIIIWWIGMSIMITGCVMKINIDKRANRDVCTPVDV